MQKLRDVLAQARYDDATTSFENYSAYVSAPDDISDEWQLLICKDGLPPYTTVNFATLDALIEYLQRGEVFFISEQSEWRPVEE